MQRLRACGRAGYFVGIAVKLIADDRQTAGRRLETKLMGAAGTGLQFKQKPVATGGDDPAVSHGFAAPRHISSDNLSPGLIRHLADRIPPHKYSATGNQLGCCRFHHRQINLFDLPSLELPGQLPSGPWGRGQQQHARDGPVQPVRHAEEATRMPTAAGRSLLNDRRTEQLAPDKTFDRFNSRHRLCR